MDYQILFDTRQRVLVARAGTAVTEESTKAVRADVRRFVAREGAVRMITDFTAVASVDLSPAFVTELARQGPVAGGVLVVVAPNPSAFAHSRMFEMQVDRPKANTHVVRSLDEAYRILGIDPPTLVPVVLPDA